MRDKIINRIEHLKDIKDGLYDGGGKSLSKDGLDWVLKCLDTYYLTDRDLPFPYMYPTPEGNLLIEFTENGYDISLEINLEDHQGQLHTLNGDESFSTSLNLNFMEAWKWFVFYIKTISKKNMIE